MIQTSKELLSTRTHYDIREDPVSQEKEGGMVGGSLAGGGAKAESSDE